MKLLILSACLAGSSVMAQSSPPPYAPASVEEIKGVADRILGYVETAAPVKVLDGTRLERTPFLLMSYEWGVTYAGMLQMNKVTGDPRYKAYAAERVEALASVAAHVRAEGTAVNAMPDAQRMLSVGGLIDPRSLDDCGSICASMIKATRAGINPAALRPWIDTDMKWISSGQFRLADGTLARNRPFPSTLWLDDLYMGVPALAQMGALTGETRYYDDAVRQILQFSARMFVPEKGLYRHGWVQDMDPHPAFFWDRANGWTVVAMTELLEVLPEDHPGRPAILKQYRAHMAGLASYQGATGLWHQLIDRPDSFLETSGSAMFVYSMARGINRGWLDGRAFAPVVSLGWNAVAQKVTAEGKVEGTCVGTGLGFDPLFYYNRPTSFRAAHGYGPTLLAAAEMIELRKNKGAEMQLSDGTVQLKAAPSRY